MIKVFEGRESLSIEAANLFRECAKKCIKKKNAFTVALSGGSTPKRMYEILASQPYRDRINWEQTDIFWVDERCVSICDERSNCRMAFDSLIEHIPVPRENVHPIECDDNAFRGAEEYEKILKEYFKGKQPRFDLIFLGLGEDGHTASLFPGTGVLNENKRAVGFIHLKNEDFHRVTLTPPVINNAEKIVFLVAGRSKAYILKEILEGPKDSDRLPAKLIMPVNGELLWLIDRDAAGMLKDIG